MGIYSRNAFAAATPIPAAGMVTVTPTGDDNIDGVLGGVRWNQTALTYTFPTSGDFFPADYGNEPGANFGEMNATQIAAINAVFKAVAALTNLTFTLVDPSVGAAAVEFTFGNTDGSDTAHAYYPDNAIIGGDVWFGRQFDYTDPQIGNYAYMTTIHEIGHALGLKHGHEEDPVLPTEHDSNEFSIMTYRSYIGNDPNAGSTTGDYGNPQTFMMYDIAALQHMYGANYNTNSGATTYKFSATTGEMFVNGVGQGAPGNGAANTLFLTVWDGGGSDTYDFSEYAGNQLIDLRPGQWSMNSTAQLADLGDGHVSRGTVFNSVLHDSDVRSLIENAIGGSGNDTFYGNQAANVLTGGAGNDRVLYEGVRADYNVALAGNGQVQVTANAGGVVDTLNSIEMVRFSDNHAYVYDVDGANADAAYKLYGGAFDRTPDYGGFKFWTEQWMDAGKTLHDAADFFLHSTEFVSRYGNSLSNEQFVDALYQNVLHRAGETDGRDFWLGYLGANTGDRADVLTNFTQLSEYTENLKPNMTNGYWVLDA